MLAAFILILIAAMVGLTVDGLSPGAMPGGWIAGILAGLVGALVGMGILRWAPLPQGPMIAGLAIVPVLVGAILVVWLYRIFAGLIASRRE